MYFLKKIMTNPIQLILNRVNAALCYLLLFSFLTSFAQKNEIIGHFTSLKGQKIYLHSFKGLGSEIIDSAVVTSKGEFKLKFDPKLDFSGFLTTSNNQKYLLQFENESIELKGNSGLSYENISITKGKINQQFYSYAKDHILRENVLAYCDFLRNTYKNDSLFINQKVFKQSLEIEINRIKKEDQIAINSIQPETYLSWYLNTRKLLNSISTIAQFRTQEIPTLTNSLRKIDYSDAMLYGSGLLKEAIENHYWLLENSGIPLDSVIEEMNSSTTQLLKSLSKDTKKYNVIANYLFDYLEKHSLFKASEYLALSGLNQNKINLESNLISKFEAYRKLKKGNIAPDIIFNGDLRQNGNTINKPTRLSEINSEYKVIIFGASWCNVCSQEMSEVIQLYTKWKSKGIEIIFVSLDVEPVLYYSYTSVFPFISFCDYKKWNTESAINYHISSSPTIYLLDRNNRIIERPKWIKSIDSWVDTKP